MRDSLIERLIARLNETSRRWYEVAIFIYFTDHKLVGWNKNSLIETLSPCVRAIFAFSSPVVRISSSPTVLRVAARRDRPTSLCSERAKCQEQALNSKAECRLTQEISMFINWIYRVTQIFFPQKVIRNNTSASCLKSHPLKSSFGSFHLLSDCIQHLWRQAAVSSASPLPAPPATNLMRTHSLCLFLLGRNGRHTISLAGRHSCPG
jgi:hypothetical protein